jgi:hypothetical protein
MLAKWEDWRAFENGWRFFEWKKLAPSLHLPAFIRCTSCAVLSPKGAKFEIGPEPKSFLS